MTKKLPPEIKQSRKPTRVACEFCHSKHLQCDDLRPCKNCTKRGMADSCKDAVRKKKTTFRKTLDPKPKTTTPNKGIRKQRKPRKKKEMVNATKVKTEQLPKPVEVSATSSINTITMSTTPPNILSAPSMGTSVSVPINIAGSTNTSPMGLSRSEITSNSGFSPSFPVPISDLSTTTSHSVSRNSKSPEIPMYPTPSNNNNSGNNSNHNRKVHLGLSETSLSQLLNPIPPLPSLPSLPPPPNTLSHISQSSTADDPGILLTPPTSNTTDHLIVDDQDQAPLEFKAPNRSHHGIHMGTGFNATIGGVGHHHIINSSVQFGYQSSGSNNNTHGTNTPGSSHSAGFAKSSSLFPGVQGNHSSKESTSTPDVLSAASDILSNASSSIKNFESSMANDEYVKLTDLLNTNPPSPSNGFWDLSDDEDKGTRPFIEINILENTMISSYPNNLTPNSYVYNEKHSRMPNTAKLVPNDLQEDEDYTSPLIMRHVIKQPDDIYLTSIVKAYQYPKAYHALISYLKKRFNKEQLIEIAKCMAKYRPSFISATKSLFENDLIFTERSFQRTLLEYENLISMSPSPTIIWRRTGEIVALTNEFATMTGYSKMSLLSKRTFIVELMDDESTIKYFRSFSNFAFGDLNATYLTDCNLRKANDHDYLKCCCVWTIKRDVFDIPMLIVGQFLPVLN